MTEPARHHIVERNGANTPVASAEVHTSSDSVAHASLHAAAGQLPPGIRAKLVDAVLDLPDVRTATRLEATVPLGDAESLQRLRIRTSHMTSRAAGSTALVDAELPAEPGDER